MTAQTLDRHVADDEIVRLLDAEAESADAGILRAHLAVCPQCTARQGELDRRSRNLSALLAASDPAMPALRAPGSSEPGVLDIARARKRAPVMQPWLRAAAVLVLLAGAALMAPPVRAWLAERVSAFGSDEATPEQPVQPAPAPSSVSFVPTGAVLSIDASTLTEGAELRFIAATGREVAARALGAGAAEMVVLPSGLRLVSAASEMIFEMRVPANVTRIRVAGVDAGIVEVDAGNLPRSVMVPPR